MAGVVGHPAFPSTMEALVSRPRGTVLDAARRALEASDIDDWRVELPHLVAPILPPSLGEDAHRWVVGPGEELPRPPGNGETVFEPSIAAVIFAPAYKLKKRDADQCIFGYTLMTYWAHGEDFAASLGPVIVTADEFDPSTELTVRVNDRVWAHGTLADAEVPFGTQVWAAAKQAPLLPGEVFWSGALGKRRRNARAPKPGAVVELSAGDLGILRTTVAPRLTRRAARTAAAS